LGVLQYREIALDQGAKPLFQSESTRRLVVKEEVGSLRPDGTRRCTRRHDHPHHTERAGGVDEGTDRIVDGLPVRINWIRSRRPIDVVGDAEFADEGEEEFTPS
jgi:hypothetical protein